METNNSFKVFPENPDNLQKTPLYLYENGAVPTFLDLLPYVAGVIFVLGIFLYPILIAIAILVIIIWFIIRQKYLDEAELRIRSSKTKKQADEYSKLLNEILYNSEIIANNILPYYDELIKNSIKSAKVDFDENAISPFWDKIEDVCRYFGFIKDSINQLIDNGELYTNVLNNKKHDFPNSFPIIINYTISQTSVDDLNLIIRKAQSKFEFANIWEHRATRQAIIAGFTGIENAILNMTNAIESSMNRLEDSITSNFRTHNQLIEDQYKTFESSAKVIQDTLQGMENKLYFIEYKKMPKMPFVRY